MLPIFFDVCNEMELNKVKEIYISIFTNLLNKFKEGGDFGQIRFLEINKEGTEEIPLLCICLLHQEVIPLDSSPPDNSKNRGKKKFSFESININNNFERNYRNNFLECVDVMYGLEPDKNQYVDDLKNNYDNFIKCLLLKLAEKYKKEIVDMAINLPKEDDEALDTENKQNNQDNE